MDSNSDDELDRIVITEDDVNSNSEEELRIGLRVEDNGDIVIGCGYPVRPTRKALKADRDMSSRRCELPGAMARKKYNRKRAVIVFFGGVGLVFLLLLL